MAIISDRQLAGAIVASRWPERYHVTVFAVALAESSGDKDVVNATGHKGLMQISPLHGNMPGDPFDPVDNLNMAYTIFKTQGWGAWVAHSSGAYRKYLPRAVRAMGNPAAPPSTSPGSGVTAAGFSEFGYNPLEGWINAVKFLSDPSNWKRLGWVVLGGMLLTIALMRMTGDNKLSPVTKAVAKAVITRKPGKAK